jgi:hypothetical protein
MNPSELLPLIEEEIRASYFLKDIRAMSFDDFFNEVDVANAYEEEWMPDFYKPFYQIVFTKIKKGEIR